MAVSTFFVQGSLTLNGVTSLVAPPGKIRIIGPNSVNLGGSQADVDRLKVSFDDVGTDYGQIYAFADSKLFLPYGDGSPTTLNGVNNPGITLRNTTSGNMFYFISGIETTLAEEGMLRIRNFVSGTAGASTVSLFPWSAGKCWLILGAGTGTDSTLITFALVDKTSKARLGKYLDTDSNIPGRGRMKSAFLWSDLNVELAAIATGATRFLGLAVEYDETQLPEYADRIAVRVSVAASGTYDLQPPAGEVWSVDFWNDEFFTIKVGGGVTAPAAQAIPGKLSLDSVNWARFTNKSASVAKDLIISGTKEPA